MKRNIDAFLKKWAVSDSRKPLIIRGARQVGKTYSVDTLGNSFQNYIRVDFEETPSVKKLFQGDLDVVKISRELAAIKGFPFAPESTLLFFDEIQACPEAIRSLRYLYEKLPQIHVIAAGSLLEFSAAAASFPVGRVRFYWMYPMTFQEFLEAREQEALLSHIPDIEATDPVPELIHIKLLDLLKEYYITGGMPEAVKTFIQSNSYIDVGSVQKDIIVSCLEDLTKHHPRTDKLLIEQILYGLASHVGRQIKYTKLIPGSRSDTIKGILEKLYKVLIAHPVYASNGEHPFKASANHKLFKTIFLDIGLMQNLCGINYEETLMKTDLMAAYEGALAEQYVGQELIAGQNTAPPELYYWTRQHQGGDAEIDFLVEDPPILPVEVKAAKAGRLRSMHQALLQFKNVPYGIVLSARNVAFLEEQRLKFLPLYSRIVRKDNLF